MSSEMLNSKCMSRDKSSDEHKTKLDAVNEEVRKFKYLNQKYNLTLSFSNYKYADVCAFHIDWSNPESSWNGRAGGYHCNNSCK